jgi:hypothetical protein
MPVTDYIETTEAVLDETANTITAAKITGLTVSRFSGSSYSDLFNFIPQLTLPAAVVVYQGSSFQDRPRRILRVSVLVIATAAWHEIGAVSARAIVDSMNAALDDHIKNQAVWKSKGDEAVDLGENIEAYLVQFEVEDH